MAKLNIEPPHYDGIYVERPLTIDEAKIKVEAALTQLFRNDFQLLTLDLNEECMVHKLACYLTAQFEGLHLDVEYNGWEKNHPKYLWFNVRTLGELNLERREVYPDIIAHWRESPVNVFVVEVKKSTNRNMNSRERDHERLISFTSPVLPDEEAFHYHVGLFLDIVTGNDIGGELLAFGTWYVEGRVERPREPLCPYPIQW